MHRRQKAAVLQMIATVIVAVLAPIQTVFAYVNDEARIRESFFDIPVMISIAKCESTYRQYTASGAPYYDSNRTYVGVFQIHERVHSKAATALGFDITTLEGNISYARYLYNRQGTGPWKGCLPKTSPAIPSPVNTPTPTPAAVKVPTTSNVVPPITLNFSYGMTHPQILSVQKILNSLGFTIALSGPGSKGRETATFGTLTKLALQRFQCAQKIACSGDAWTTGYGRIGPLTRAALNRTVLITP